MIASKIARFYSGEILENVRGIRGFTRIFIELKKLALKLDTVETSNGFEYNFNRQKLLISNRESFYSTFEETGFIDSFQDSIKDDSIVCDVGAYHGIYSLIGAKGEKVHSFEASPKNAEKLRENIELQEEDNFEVVRGVVWEEETRVQTEGIEGGGNQVLNQGQEMEALTLDKYFEDKQKPDVIKIDVEGAELQVIEGAENILRNHKPKLFIEAHQDQRTQNFGYKRQKLFERLESLGYEIKEKRRRGKQYLVQCQPIL